MRHAAPSAPATAPATAQHAGLPQPPQPQPRQPARARRCTVAPATALATETAAVAAAAAATAAAPAAAAAAVRPDAAGRRHLRGAHAVATLRLATIVCAAARREGRGNGWDAFGGGDDGDDGDLLAFIDELVGGSSSSSSSKQAPATAAAAAMPRSRSGQASRIAPGSRPPAIGEVADSKASSSGGGTMGSDGIGSLRPPHVRPGRPHAKPPPPPSLVFSDTDTLIEVGRGMRIPAHANGPVRGDGVCDACKHMHGRLSACTYACMQTHVCADTQAHAHACMHANTPSYRHTHTHACMQTHVCAGT
eukprot:354230-Chlamydomonas_euryale.AAC.3